MTQFRTKLATAAAAAAFLALPALSASTAEATLTGTFDFALGAFPDRGDEGLDAAGPFKLAPNTTRVFDGAALDDSDITVSSLVTSLGGNRYRAIFRMETEEGHEFIPAGTTFNGDPITSAVIDLGGFFYGTSDPVNFASRVVNPDPTDDGFFIEVNDAPRGTLDFKENYLANDMALEGYGIINGRPGEVISGRGFDGFQVTIEYTLVPEPGAAALALAG